MQACFDASGFLLWATAGDIMPSVPAGAELREVVADDPAGLFLDRDRAGALVTKPLTVPIGVDRTLVAPGDAGAKLTLPDPCWLLVDGVRVHVVGGRYIVAPKVAGLTRVELTGAHRSDPVVIEAQPLADAEAMLLARIDADREARQMAVMTSGGAKKYVYNRKAVEAIDSRTLVQSVLNALSLVDRQKRFPFATAEASLTGETLSTVLARYEAGLNTSAAKVASIEAQAMKAKRAVRAATTLPAKVAAANIQWSA